MSPFPPAMLHKYCTKAYQSLGFEKTRGCLVGWQPTLYLFAMDQFLGILIFSYVWVIFLTFMGPNPLAEVKKKKKKFSFAFLSREKVPALLPKIIAL